MKKAVFVAVLVVFLGAFASAQSNAYFATTPGGWVTVNSGPATNMGPYVDVASVSIPAGSYLLFGYVQTFSYIGNAGIDCQFYVNHAYGSAAGSERLNGSGDGTYGGVLTGKDLVTNNPVTVKSATGRDISTFLGKINSTTGGTLTISCLKTYGATSYSLVNGTLAAVQVTFP